MVLTIPGSLGEAVLRGMMLPVGFVTNSSTFPQPLNEEEEEARAALIERNLRLVAHIVNTTWAKSQVNQTMIYAGVI